MKTYQNPDFQIVYLSLSDILTASGFHAEAEGIGDSVGIDSLNFR